VVVAGVTADKPHDLVHPENALRPAFTDKALQVPVDRGQAGSPFRHAFPDLLHRQWAVRIPQYPKDAFALRRLPHAGVAEGGGG